MSVELLPRFRRGWLLAAAGAIALLIAACSGSSDTANADVAPDVTPPVAVEPATTETSAAPPTSAPAEQPTSAPVASPQVNDATLPCRGETGQTSETRNTVVGRTDIDPSGNRNAPGSIDLLNAPVLTAELPASATWIVPFFANDDPCQAHWYVTLDDGQAVIVDASGTVTSAGEAVAPPETAPGSLRSAHEDLDQFTDPLVDSRVVSFGRWTAALVEPTDRYGHGVLGDRIEAGAVEVIDTISGERTRIIIDAPSVVEGISPMLIDVDETNGDSGAAVPEVLVTLSNSDDGAWLALYNLDGTLRAQSAPIGRGNRWRNQLGAGSIGPDGELLIVDVRTPHLDGVVEFFRVNGDQLEVISSTTGYTNHPNGSRNLDLGILVDADADSRVEVVLPTRDMGSLAIVDHGAEGAFEVGRIELGSSLSTNVASQSLDGQALVAVGTRDRRLLIFG